MAEFRQHMTELLLKARDEKNIVALHEHPSDPDSFVVGFIVAVSGEQINLRALNTRGQDDGLLVIHIDNVRRVHWDSDYLRRVQFLHTHPPVLHAPADSLINAGASSLASVFEAAMHANALVTIHGDGMRITAMVKSVGEDWAELEIILDTGTSDGSMVIPFIEIERLDVGGINEQLELAVHKARYGIG